MSPKELSDWSLEHFKENEEGLLKGCTMVSALNKNGFTLWWGDTLYER
jgi:hypothetical protein